MAIRMSGLASGMDTESIIKELMSAKSMKKTKIEQDKTKLEWKQEKWQDLNTKLYKLYQEQASKLRLQSTYMVKKASSSNENIATVTANSSATNGSYTLEVSNVATSQYLTSAQVASGTKGTTKLADMDPSLLNKELQVTAGGKTNTVWIRSGTTVNDFVSCLKGAGINANFDEAQGRFFISSKDSGEKSAFSISTVSLTTDEVTARNNIENFVSYDKLNGANQTIVHDVLNSISFASTDEEKTKARNDAITKLTDVYVTQEKKAASDGATQVMKARLYNQKYAENYNTVKAEVYDKDEAGNFTTIKEAFTTKYGNEYDIMTAEEREKVGVSSRDEYIQKQVNNVMDTAAKKATTNQVNKMISGDADTKAQIAALTLSGMTEEQLAAEGFSDAQKEEYKLTAFNGTERFNSDAYMSQLNEQVTVLVDNYASVDDRFTTTDGKALNKLGFADVAVQEDGSVTVAGGANDATNPSIPSGMALIEAKDSVFKLNGATMQSASTSFTVNGLTVNLKNETTAGQTVNFAISNDVDGVYDNIKSFVTQYNAIVTEMNTLYNADNAKGYEPLSEDEKNKLSDSAVEKWETKIKGALFKNDSTVDSILSGMRTALNSGVKINGKTYSLASYGVSTSTNYTEGGLLHIYGDSTDGTYAGYKDKLKKALQEDPDTVMQVFSQVGQALYDTMSKKMASSQINSAMTFYNDKQIKNQLKDYSDQIDDWTDRLQDMEDDYYKQFSAMETTMAKLNSQTNSLSSMLGSN